MTEEGSLVGEGLKQLTRLIEEFLCVSHTASAADLRADTMGDLVKSMEPRREVHRV